MFNWVTQQLETISQAVAPPPTDPPGLFVHCCTRADEQGAMEAAYQFGSDAGSAMPMSLVIVNVAKQQTALHVACQYGLLRVMDYLLTSSAGGDLNHIVHVCDAVGDTPLHAAASSAGSNKDAIYNMVHKLVTEFHASPLAKNHAGQTPYDVATLDRIRQYLLPIQLQRETQQALDNGGVGLPPGVDLGGLRINYSNSSLPPPPMGGPPPMMNLQQQQQQQDIPPGPPASVFDTPLAAHKSPIANSADIMPEPPLSTTSQPPLAGTASAASPYVASSSNDQPSLQQQPPSSGGSNSSAYATRGYSSAHIYNPKNKRVLLPDGFHSSSSDKRLQEKYGHSQAPTSGQRLAPPPPTSGNAASIGSMGNTASGDGSLAPPGSTPGGPNPFAGGHSVFASGGARAGLQRYVPIDPMTGRPMPQAPYAAVSAPASAAYPSFVSPPGVPGVSHGFGQGQQQQQQQQQQPTLFMPPPAGAYQSPAAPSAPISRVVATASGPSSGSLFPAPPRRTDLTSPRSQSMSTFPSPPAGVLGTFPTPPRVSSEGQSSISAASTATPAMTSSPFAQPPAAAVPFPSPPGLVASKFPAPPPASSISKFPPAPTATASSLFASPPPARVGTAPAASDAAAEVSKTVSPQDIFSTPQLLPQQSATALFSSQGTSPSEILNADGSAERDEDAPAAPLQQAPKSGESVKSAIELFGSPFTKLPKELDPVEVPANLILTSETTVTPAPKSGESIKSAAELFGVPSTASAAFGKHAESSDSIPENVDFEYVGVGAKAIDLAQVEVEPEPAQKTFEVDDIVHQPSSEVEHSSQTDEVSDTIASESPSKLLDEESEAMQEVPLSPAKEADV
ncbi:hypothetical protein MPSEU_000388900 [Mayamaea pseudoterrestris]|nr:hypothetical protein MPSEU_000388900 [Mayamaea pseudoterrestris]